MQTSFTNASYWEHSTGLFITEPEDGEGNKTFYNPTRSGEDINLLIYQPKNQPTESSKQFINTQGMYNTQLH